MSPSHSSDLSSRDSLSENPSIDISFEESITDLGKHIFKLYSTIDSQTIEKFNHNYKNAIHKICQCHLESLKDIFALHIDLDKPQESKDNLIQIKKLSNIIGLISKKFNINIDIEKFNDDLKNIIKQKGSLPPIKQDFSGINSWLHDPKNEFTINPSEFQHFSTQQPNSLPNNSREILPCDTQFSRLPTIPSDNLSSSNSENLIYDIKRNFYVLYKGDNERALHFDSIKDIADNFTEYFNSLNKEDRRFLMGKRIKPWTDPHSHKISYTDDIYENESGARFIELEFYDKFKCKQLIRMEVLLDEIKSYKTFEHLSSGYVETKEKNFELQLSPPTIPQSYYYIPPTNYYPLAPNYGLNQSPQNYYLSPHNYSNPLYQQYTTSSMPLIISIPGTTIIPTAKILIPTQGLTR